MYFIFALSFGNIVYLGSSGDFGNITIFALIGFLTTFFSKNMVVILSIALVFSSIIKYGINLKQNEGFTFTTEDKTKIKSAINQLLGDDDDEGFEGFEEEDDDGFEGFEGFEEEDEDGFEGFEGFEEEEGFDEEEGFEGFEEDEGFEEEEDGFEGFEEDDDEDGFEGFQEGAKNKPKPTTKATTKPKSLQAQIAAIKSASAQGVSATTTKPSLKTTVTTLNNKIIATLAKTTAAKTTPKAGPSKQEIDAAIKNADKLKDALKALDTKTTPKTTTKKAVITSAKTSAAKLQTALKSLTKKPTTKTAVKKAISSAITNTANISATMKTLSIAKKTTKPTPTPFDIQQLIKANPNVKNDPNSMMMINMLINDPNISKNPNQLRRMVQSIIDSANRAAKTSAPTKAMTTFATTTANSSSFVDLKSIAGLTNWYDASNPNGNGKIPANGETIKTWVDKSPRANNMIAQKAGIYTTNGQNGLGTVKFNKSWYRTVTANADYPFNAFIVVKLDTLSKPLDIMTCGSRSRDNFNSLTFNEHPTAKGRWHNGSSGFSRTPKAVANVTENATGFLIMQWSLTNNNFYIYRNGVEIMKTNAYTWGRPSDPEFALGTRHHDGRSHLLEGSIAEVAIFNNQLTTDNRQKVEGYLAWKWGINSSLPKTHPYSGSAPGPGSKSSAPTLSTLAATVLATLATLAPTSAATIAKTSAATIGKTSAPLDVKKIMAQNPNIQRYPEFIDQLNRAARDPNMLKDPNMLQSRVQGIIVQSNERAARETTAPPLPTIGKTFAPTYAPTYAPTLATLSSAYVPTLPPATLPPATLRPATISSVTDAPFDVPKVIENNPNVGRYPDLVQKLNNVVKESNAEANMNVQKSRKDGFAGDPRLDRASTRLKGKVQGIINEGNARASKEIASAPTLSAIKAMAAAPTLMANLNSALNTIANAPANAPSGRQARNVAATSAATLGAQLQQISNAASLTPQITSSIKSAIRNSANITTAMEKIANTPPNIPVSIQQVEVAKTSANNIQSVLSSIGLFDSATQPAGRGSSRNAAPQAPQVPVYVPTTTTPYYQVPAQAQPVQRSSRSGR